MKILALDLSMARTGWALSRDGELAESGSAEATAAGTKIWAAASEGARFLAMDRALTRVLESCAPDLVIFPEFYGTQNAGAARSSLGLRGVLLRRCAVLKIEAEARNEGKARSGMGVDLAFKLNAAELLDYERRLGKRKPGSPGKTKPKRDMKGRVAARLTELGHVYADDDEADAMLLLLAELKGIK